MSKTKVIAAVVGGLLVFGMVNDLLTDDPTAAPTPTVTQSAPAKVTPTEKPKPVVKDFVVWLTEQGFAETTWGSHVTRAEDGYVYTDLYPKKSNEEAGAMIAFQYSFQYAPEFDLSPVVRVYAADEVTTLAHYSVWDEKIEKG